MARMTIRDIARLAGVSVTTVSRALNNAPEINSQTRERVLQVCREQGYRSNLLARSLVSSRTRVLGVILPELSGPFHASIVLHLERYAQEQDYQIMLCCGRVGGSETAALFDFLVSHRVDGILLVSASSAAPDLLRRHARGTPSVLLGDVSPTATLQRINAVSTDNYVGGAMAAGYLSRLGHRRVLYLGPPAGQRHPCAPAPGLSHHRQGAGHGGGDRLQPRRRLLRPQRLPAGQAGVRPPLPADGGLRSLRRHGPGCPPGGRRAGTGHSRPDLPAGL